MDLLRPLTAHADAAWCTGHAADQCSHFPLSGDAQHAALVGPPHRTRRNHLRCDGAVLSARLAEIRFPMLRGDFPATIRGSLRIARQRYQQWIVKGSDERIISG